MQFKELSQIILAVSSGRADAFTTTVLSSTIAKEKNLLNKEGWRWFHGITK